MKRPWQCVFLSLAVLVAAAAVAGEVTVKFVELSRQGDGPWRAEVTLRHADTGWDDYADAWRIVTPSGKVLATRTLWHPHVDEQPFSRSLGGIRIPPGIRTVFVEGHDKVHGWSPQRVRVDLDRASGEHYRVRR